MLVNKGLKKFGLVAVVTAIIIIPFVVSAQTSLDFPSSFAGLSSQDLKVTIQNIVRIVLGFLGILAVLLILYGGFVWMTSGGNADKISQAKKIIISAVIGLLLILTSYGIASFIINNLIGGTSTGVPPGGPPGPPPPTAIGSGIIESHYPGVDATGIARNTKVVITFKEKIDPATMNAGTVTIKNLETAQEYQNDVSYNTTDNLTFIIQLTTPDLYYGSASGDQRHQILLKGGAGGIAKLAGGDALPAVGYAWSFTVSSFLDTTAPYVVSVIPVGSGVARNTLVQINYSEAVNPATASGPASPTFNITLTDSTGTVASGFYSIGSGYQITEFISDVSCGENSCGGTVYCLNGPETYEGLVTGGVEDMAGNKLSPEYTWNFITNNLLDLVPPHIIKQVPTHNSIDFGITDPLEVHFSKPMSVSSVNSTNIGISGPGVGYWLDLITGNQVKISHTPFNPVSGYDVAVKSGVTDINQNCYFPCSCNDPGGSCGCYDPEPGCSGTSCTAVPD